VAHWLEERFELILSRALLEELRQTLGYPRVKKYVRLDAGAVDGLVAAFATLAVLVPGALSIQPKLRDVDDDKVLVAALEGTADYVVTGDQDLLVLGFYEQIQILTPREFLGVMP
jgi:putative PIN family toxin of toxin-antitoxin system